MISRVSITTESTPVGELTTASVTRLAVRATRWRHVVLSELGQLPKLNRGKVNK